MSSFQSKFKTTKNESVYEASRASSLNVNSLKKIFEGNLKFLNLSNTFKSKGHKTNKVADKNVPIRKDKSALQNNENISPKKPNISSRNFNKELDLKFNRKSANSNHNLGSSEKGSYLNCRIENCCCKTFFREYTNTPNFKYRPLPKTPLRERNSYFNRVNSQIPSETHNLPKIVECVRKNEDSSVHFIKNCKPDFHKNKVYKINYEFYDSKAQTEHTDLTITPVNTQIETINLKSVPKHIPHKISVNQLKLKFDAKNSKNILFKKLDGSMKISRDDHLLNGKNTVSIQDKCSKKKNINFHNSGFVNFTVDSLNEGGYLNLNKCERSKSEETHLNKKLQSNNNYDEHQINYSRADSSTENKNNKSEKYITQRTTDKISFNESFKLNFENTSYIWENPRNEIFNSKHKSIKTKNIALKEQSYPYILRKPKLTVKKVKNRNMNNIKKKQNFSGKSLNRAQSFSGYDNFAYRRSITELKLPNISNDRKVSETKLFEYSAENYSLRKSDSYEHVPVLQSENDQQIFTDHNISHCNWPITSFYIEKDGIESFDNSFHVKENINSNLFYSKSKAINQSFDFNVNQGNLKRHFSLGYLDEECLEYNLNRRRRSLDNISKVSTTCGIRNLPEVNSKINKPRKFHNLDIHAHALFAAVEHGYVEKTKTILESSDVDVNSLNSDGFSPLDVAVLSNNRPLVKLLVSYGAQEGRKFYSVEDIRSHLHHLLYEAERRIQELSSSLRPVIESDQSSLSSSSSNIPSITVGDSSQNKTYSIWDRRSKGLKRMLMGFEQIRPPDLPALVTIEVTSTSSIMVHFAPNEHKDSSITTKFKVQWSLDKEFCSLCGNYEVADTRQMKYQIKNLRKGQSYYVRVAAGNIKGYSAYKLSTPSFLVPSSWQDVANTETRFSTSLKEILDDIFSQVVVNHPYLKSNVELYGLCGELLVSNRRKKTTIKQLFTAASKFQKHLRRGVYLSCLLYHEDKVLVTNEDFLPVIEVDETYPKKIFNDFHWFFKVAFSWNDLKWLKSDMEKSQNSSAVFRIKLLQAAVYMQTALSLQELGKLYHKLIRDAEGTIVISVINYIHSPKSVSVLNLRWLALSKLTKRTNIVNVAESNVADILMSTIPDQIAYHQLSGIKLPRGLYLSYLKIRSSVDSVQVLVPSRTPNIPPHCKIRDNPHVTAEEWEWFMKKENLKENLPNASYQQRLFVEQIAVTARRLFTYMEVTDENAANHRLYDTEVIEVNKDVSLIMIVPPVEAACSIPGQRELLLQRSDLLPLTIQIFEIVHFGIYQLDLVSNYSRLSCIIEMDIDLAQYSLRKAFSSNEVSSAKSKLTELENLHSQLNTLWKQGRWLLDVISFARGRVPLSPINIRNLLAIHPKRTLPPSEHCYLLPPDPKTAKSRGSWPGVGIGRNIGRVPNEISRSEQHLTSDSVASTQSSLKVAAQTSSSVKTVSEPARSNENILVEQNNDQRKNNRNKQLTGGNSYSSLHSISSDEIIPPKTVITKDEDEIDVIVPVPSSLVLEVNAAYNTRLNTPVQFKFHVNSRTTAREIVELFVKQTNMSLLLKGKDSTIYPEEEMANFCLVAVLGARERCLRDDFKLIQLQPPWKNGRLYVRRKSNVLAAIEYDSKQSSFV